MTQSPHTAALGTLRVKYSVPDENYYKGLLFVILLGGGAFLYLLFFWFLVALTERPEEILPVAALFGLIGVYPLWRYGGRAYRLIDVPRVWVYDNGFQKRTRRTLQQATWDEVVSLYIKAQRLGVDYLPDTAAVRASARLNRIVAAKLVSGETIYIESATQQMTDVIRSIGRRHAVNTFSKIERKLAAGDVYYFGNIIIEGDRLTYDNLGYRWYPMQKVTFSHAGDMVIVQQGAPRPKKLLPIADIPNLHLLMMFLSQHAEVIDFDGATVDLEKWRKSVRKS